MSRLKKNLLAYLGPQQKVVLGGGFKDGLKAVCLTCDSAVAEPNLHSGHEEADTRLLLHAKHAATSHPRIVIQSPDTDVAVLLIAHFSYLNCQELWLKTGVKDRLRYLPVHEIQAFLGESLCRCLPSFHALTGCDSTSAFSGIGKKKAWKVLLTKEQMQRDLCTLGQNPAIHEPAQKAAESFICSLYTSAKNFSNVDDAR